MIEAFEQPIKHPLDSATLEDYFAFTAQLLKKNRQLEYENIGRKNYIAMLQKLLTDAKIPYEDYCTLRQTYLAPEAKKTEEANP